MVLWFPPELFSHRGIGMEKAENLDSSMDGICQGGNVIEHGGKRMECTGKKMVIWR